MANRVIDANISKPNQSKGEGSTSPDNATQQSDEPDWFRSYREQQEQRLQQPENAKVL